MMLKTTDRKSTRLNSSHVSISSEGPTYGGLGGVSSPLSPSEWSDDAENNVLDDDGSDYA